MNAAEDDGAVCWDGTAAEMADAYNHLQHAELIVTICVYPPENGQQGAIWIASNIKQDLPLMVVRMIGDALIQFGQSVVDRVDQQHKARFN